MYRFEVKDYVDVWQIWKKERISDFLSRDSLFRGNVSWRQILKEAKSKEAGIDSVIIANMLKTIPIEEFEKIKWVKKVNFKTIVNELKIIGNEILGL